MVRPFGWHRRDRRSRSHRHTPRRRSNDARATSAAVKPNCSRHAVQHRSCRSWSDARRTRRPLHRRWASRGLWTTPAGDHRSGRVSDGVAIEQRSSPPCRHCWCRARCDDPLPPAASRAPTCSPQTTIDNPRVQISAGTGKVVTPTARRSGRGRSLPRSPGGVFGLAAEQRVGVQLGGADAAIFKLIVADTAAPDGPSGTGEYLSVRRFRGSTCHGSETVGQACPNRDLRENRDSRRIPASSAVPDSDRPVLSSSGCYAACAASIVMETSKVLTALPPTEMTSNVWIFDRVVRCVVGEAADAASP